MVQSAAYSLARAAQRGMMYLGRAPFPPQGKKSTNDRLLGLFYVLTVTAARRPCAAGELGCSVEGGPTTADIDAGLSILLRV